MDENGIEFRDPPDISRQGAKPVWLYRLQPLVEHPNRWAVVFSGPLDKARATTQNLSRGRLRLPAGRWEFISRKTADGAGEVFARFLGDDEAVSA